MSGDDFVCARMSLNVVAVHQYSTSSHQPAPIVCMGYTICRVFVARRQRCARGKRPVPARVILSLVGFRDRKDRVLKQPAVPAPCPLRRCVTPGRDTLSFKHHAQKPKAVCPGVAWRCFGGLAGFKCPLTG